MSKRARSCSTVLDLAQVGRSPLREDLNHDLSTTGAQMWTLGLRHRRGSLTWYGSRTGTSSHWAEWQVAQQRRKGCASLSTSYCGSWTTSLTIVMHAANGDDARREVDRSLRLHCLYLPGR